MLIFILFLISPAKENNNATKCDKTVLKGIDNNPAPVNFINKIEKTSLKTVAMVRDISGKKNFPVASCAVLRTLRFVSRTNPSDSADNIMYPFADCDDENSISNKSKL